MASTIKLKNGSGAPLASDLVQGEPALDLTNKRLYTEDSGGDVIEVGTNPTELQVDNINIDGNTISSTDTDGNIAITPNGTGEVDISKVDIDSGTIDGTVIGGTTTAAGSFTTLQADTSLNVDGTVTADGLTVEDTGKNPTITLESGFNGSWTAGDAKGTINFYGSDTSGSGVGNHAYIKSLAQDTFGVATQLQFGTSGSGGEASPRLTISNEGDISFYEDTGATAKFFWDASAERLGVGIASPTVGKIHADGASASDSGVYASAAGGSKYALYGVHSGVYGMSGYYDGTDYWSFYGNGKAYFGGNVGIGTSSPSSANAVNRVVNVDAPSGQKSGISLSEAGANFFDVFFDGSSNSAHLYNGASGGMLFYGSGTEHMRIDSSGNLDMTNGGGDIIMANGAGIDFSASEGAGATSSVLDDYEEGTWTPVAGRSLTNPTVTYSTQTGIYTKIGRTVYVQWDFTISGQSANGSGVIQVEGLPFTVASGGGFPIPVLRDSNAIPAAGTDTRRLAGVGTSTEIVMQYDNIGTAGFSSAGSITAAWAIGRCQGFMVYQTT